MAYDRAITDLNAHRMAGTSFSLISALSDAANASGEDVSLSPLQTGIIPNSLQSSKILPTFNILSSITDERPKLPPSHASAHILNTSLLERAYSRGYLGKQDSSEALELRRRIAEGSRRALETQWVHPSLRTGSNLLFSDA